MAARTKRPAEDAEADDRKRGKAETITETTWRWSSPNDALSAATYPALFGVATTVETAVWAYTDCGIEDTSGTTATLRSRSLCNAVNTRIGVDAAIRLSLERTAVGPKRVEVERIGVKVWIPGRPDTPMLDVTVQLNEHVDVGELDGYLAHRLGDAIAECRVVAARK